MPQWLLSLHFCLSQRRFPAAPTTRAPDLRPAGSGERPGRQPRGLCVRRSAPWRVACRRPSGSPRRLVPQPRPALRRQHLRRGRCLLRVRAHRSPASPSNYGMLVPNGAPVTAPVAPGNVRVVVSRNVASVPNCPNWERPSQPNYNNRMMPNLGCAVNSNLAAMVANPEDLVHGRSMATASPMSRPAPRPSASTSPRSRPAPRA